MKPAELENLLRQQIPLTAALQISVANADDLSVELRAPLEPNRNHMGTAFGGSLNAVMVLAGYAWLFRRMATRGYPSHVVIKKSTIEYLLPVSADFAAIAKGPSVADFENFLIGFERKGRARVQVLIEIHTPKGVACRLSCEFVAKRAAQTELD